MNHEANYRTAPATPGLLTTLVEVKMPPKSTSTLTCTRRLVICDHCGEEYEPRILKEHTETVNPG